MMTRWQSLAVIAATSAMLLTGAMSLQAQDDNAVKEDKPAKKLRLFSPYSKMTSLSDEQRQQIADIRKVTLAEKRKLDVKEQEEIMALLSDEQKAEAEKIKSDEKVAKKKSDAAESVE